MDLRGSLGLGRTASGDSDAGGPCSGRCPGLRQSPGWSGPLLSSRRSLSLVPPSTKFRRHLHEFFVNDALPARWVNSASAISLIFTSAVTCVPGSECVRCCPGNGTDPGNCWNGWRTPKSATNEPSVYTKSAAPPVGHQQACLPKTDVVILNQSQGEMRRRIG